MATIDLIRSKVGFYLGLSRDATAWTVDELSWIDEIINDGYKQFLYPSLDGISYHWSFLQKMTTLSTVANDYEYDLPADFSNILGQMHYSGQIGYTPVSITSLNVMLSLIGDTTTGRPTIAAIYKDYTSTEKSVIRLHKIPDAVYTLNYVYEIEPSAISATVEPVGGQRHYSTLVASCMAVAERQNGDALGTHAKYFRERLLASISEDRKNHIFDTLGSSNYRGVPYSRHSDVETTLFGVEQ